MFSKDNWATWILILLAVVIVSVLAVLALRGTFEVPLGSSDIYKELVDQALESSK